MARPPLTREQLEAEAQYVYVGRVEAVRDGEADVVVERVEQAVLGGGEEGTVTVGFRREQGAAPPGETGDYGQHSPLPEGALVRLYVTYDGDGRAQLLEPNGWEPAE